MNFGDKFFVANFDEFFEEILTCTLIDPNLDPLKFKKQEKGMGH